MSPAEPFDRQPILETERLVLRPWREADFDALYAVARDPLIWAIHPAHDRWQEPVFRAFMDGATDGGGAIVVIDKARGQIIGSSRWQGLDPADGGSVEIGWTFLARDYWGGSWNRELKRAMIAHALRGVGQVWFMVGEDNLRSRRALEKIGARLDPDYREVRQMAGQPVTHLRYLIDRTDFAEGPLEGE